MGLENLFSGVKDMLDKAKNLVEEKTGVDIDNIEETLSHPGDLLDKAKEKGTELFQKAKEQFMGDDSTEAPVATENGEKVTEGNNP